MKTNTTSDCHLARPNILEAGLFLTIRQTVISITPKAQAASHQRQALCAKSLRVDGGWSVRLGNDGRLNMNAQKTNEIRELTTAEANEVTGGSILRDVISLAWGIATGNTGQACCYGDDRTTETSK